MIGQLILAVFYVFFAYMICRFLFPVKILAHFQRIVDERRGK